MKKLLSLLMLACALGSFPLVTGMTCSQSQQKTTYTTLFGIGTAVNSAYAAYMDQVVAGKSTFNAKIAQGYNDFQAALSAAVTIAQGNTAAVAPSALIDQGNALITSIPRK